MERIAGPPLFVRAIFHDIKSAGLSTFNVVPGRSCTRIFNSAPPVLDSIAVAEDYSIPSPQDVVAANVEKVPRVDSELMVQGKKAFQVASRSAFFVAC